MRLLRLTPLETRLAPAVATWDGGSAASALWSDAANWVGDVAPQPGDDLVFPAGAARPTNTNDFAASTAFRAIRVTGSGYVINGNAVALAAGLAANGPLEFSDAVVGFDITLSAPQTFAAAGGLGVTLTGAVDLNGHTLTVDGRGYYSFIDESNLAFAGPIGGSGGLVKVGEGTVVLRGANAYVGLTDIHTGQLVAGADTALGATGPGNGTSVGHDGSLFVGRGGTYITVAEAVEFAGRPAGQDSLQGGGTTLTGPLTLAGPTRFAGSFTFTGVIGETGGPQELSLFSGGFGGGVTTFAPGSAAAYTGRTVVEFGGVRFDGTGPNGPIEVRNGTIGGNGRIGPVVITGGGGIAPAVADGLNEPLSTLTVTGDVNLPDTVDYGVLRIINLLPDGRSDRLVVQGTVSLSGRLTVGGLGNPTLTPGTRFRVIDNDGTDPIHGIFLGNAEGDVIGTVNARYLRVTYRGGDGNDVELVADALAASGLFAVAPAAGGGPLVRVYDGGGTLLRTILAYDPSFRGGVHVATATGAGSYLVTAPGPGGGPHVKVFDGASGRLLTEFNAYDTAFRGGLFVAFSESFDNEGPAVVTAPGAGGAPLVRAFRQLTNNGGSGPNLFRNFYAYDPSFTGGVSVAVGDIDGDGLTDIVTGPGPGGGPDVRVFGFYTHTLIREFNAYDPSFRGGVFVAAGDLNGDRRADIVTGPGVGGGPLLRTFDGATGAPLAAFYAYDANFRGGVTVGAMIVAGRAEVLTGAGAGGGPHVVVGLPTRFGLLAFDPAFLGGVFVG